MANEIEMINVSGTDYEVADATARENINSLDERVDIVEGLCDTFATKSELGAVRQSFQDGVDLIAKACDDRGSTPAGQYPYTPQAVADAIRAIPGGGGGACYSMIPQEIHRHGSDWCCAEYRPYIIIDRDIDIFVAHILPTSETNNININIDVDLYSYYTGTFIFSLVVDDSTVIPNIGSVTIAKTYEYIKCTISYTFSTPLTMEYHTIAVRPTAEDNFNAEGYWFMCNVYGTGFTAVEYPGMYLINRNFINFIPNNFVLPNDNPYIYSLSYDKNNERIQSLVVAMNLKYDDEDYDSGKSFYMKGCSGYYYEDPEYGCGGAYIQVPVDPVDTLVFNDGKFTYTHSQKREFPNDYGVYCHEVHSFLIPFTNKLFRAGDYINIHGTFTFMSGQPEVFDSCRPIVIMRENEYTIDSQIDGNTLYQSQYQQGDEFILSVDVSNINSDYINFIGLYFDISTNHGLFTIEIDKIQVTKQPQGSGGQPC